MGKAREERYRVIAALLQSPEPAWLEIIPQARAYSRRLPAGRIRDTIEAFLKAGAEFVGAGGDLAGRALIDAGETEEITRRARSYVAAITRARP